MPSRRTLEIPESVFFSARTLEELEDRLAADNPRFLARMRRIRGEEDMGGKGKDLSEVLRQRPAKRRRRAWKRH